MIAVIDYGMGNLRSVEKALERVGGDARITADPHVIRDARGAVLPGVGAFADCMRNLEKFKLIHPILDFVSSNRPFLGICLGLQLLFAESFEFGRHEGLGIIPGIVTRFSGEHFIGPGKLKVPHMGWNQVRWEKGKMAPFDAAGDNQFFYFVHSYYVIPRDDICVAGTTEYGVEFVSAVSRGNIFATQFHPEKSQLPGLAILKSFEALTKRWP